MRAFDYGKCAKPTDCSTFVNEYVNKTFNGTTKTETFYEAPPPAF
jgi:hypothetical protein